MLYCILSFICRFCAVLAGLLPIVTIEAGINHFFAYILGSLCCAGLCLGCFLLSEYLDNKRKVISTPRKKKVTHPTEHPQAA